MRKTVINVVDRIPHIINDDIDLMTKGMLSKHKDSQKVFVIQYQGDSDISNEDLTDAIQNSIRNYHYRCDQDDIETINISSAGINNNYKIDEFGFDIDEETRVKFFEVSLADAIKNKMISSDVAKSQLYPDGTHFVACGYLSGVFTISNLLFFDI